MKPVAQILSVILHPLFLPSYAILLVIYTNPYMFGNMEPEGLGRIMIIVVVNTLAFPALASLLLVKLGFVKSLQMESKLERTLPFIASGVFYIWCFMVFKRSPLPQILNVTILGAPIGLFTTFIINIFRKISLHAVGMGSLVGLMILLTMISNFNLIWILYGVILLAGIVGSCRLYLSAHALPEVMVGYLIGITSMFFAFRYF